MTSNNRTAFEYEPVEINETCFDTIELDYPFKISNGKISESDFGIEVFGTVLRKDKPIATFCCAMDEHVTLDIKKPWSMTSKWDFVKAVRKEYQDLRSKENSTDADLAKINFLCAIEEGSSQQFMEQSRNSKLFF